MPSLNNRDLTVSIRSTADTSGITETERALSRMDDGQKKNLATFESWKKTGTIAAIAVGAAAAAGAASAVSSYSDYESSLSRLRQASGATSEEMSKLAKLSRDLGKDTSLAGVTAADAAQAMVELSKAGLSVNDTMAASRGVLSLAKAGNIDFADAATIAASALNAFGLEGKDASKVADMLAAGANASQAELSDLALGMQQSATVAKQFKLTMNDNVTALSLFANSGIKGSDAGTSLKTMLIALAKPSDSAAAAMQKVGFNAYDAQGNFVGLREMAIRLQKSMSNLTEEQKQNTLATIFGTDAFRAAAILSDNAGASYDRMSAAVGRQGAAQDAARANLGATQKAMENLSNAVSDLGLQIGGALAPIVTQVANVAASNLTPAFNGVMAVMAANTPIIAGLAAGWAAYRVIQGVVTAATVLQTVAQTSLNAVMAANPVTLLITMFAGLGASLFASTLMTNGAKDATDRLNNAQMSLKDSTNALKDADDQLSGANTRLEGAHLQVERATRNLDSAIRTYGVGSLEAREAANQLRAANDNLKDATNRQKDAANNASTAHDNLRAAQQRDRDETDKLREAKKQLASATATSGGVISNFGGTVDGVTGKISWQHQKVGDLQSRLQAMRGQQYDYSVVGHLREVQESQGVSKKAKGGAVHGGSPYIVGDNPDGTFNSTTELFVPDTNGQIFSAKDLQKAISGGFRDGGSGQKITNNINVNVTTAEAAREVFAIMNGDMRLVGKGMAMTGGGY